jgi:hypothetical protein
MQNIESVKRLQTHNSLCEYTPYFSFLEEFIFLFMIDNLLIKITVVRELHYDAEWK